MVAGHEHGKKHTGYIGSQIERMDGYLLRYLNNRPYSSKAVIPRKGLPGNKDGRQVCISLRRHLRKKDGLKLDSGWVRFYFCLENGVLRYLLVYQSLSNG